MSFVRCVPGQKRANGEGEDEAGLTGVAAGAGASSGVVGAERDGEGDLRGRSWGRRGRGVSRAGERSGLGLFEAVEDGGDDGQLGGARGRRCDHGVVGHGAGRVKERSWGEGEVSARSGATCVTDLGFQGGEGRKQGGGQLRGARCGRRRAPACLPGRAKQLAGAAAGLGRQVGRVGRQVTPSLSLFFYFFSVSFVLQLCLIK